MEAELNSVLDQRGLSLDELMKQYYENRKKYHRIKILKEKYIESWFNHFYVFLNYRIWIIITIFLFWIGFCLLFFILIIIIAKIIIVFLDLILIRNLGRGKLGTKFFTSKLIMTCIWCCRWWNKSGCWHILKQKITLLKLISVRWKDCVCLNSF